ncbi:MAG: aldo/keto reductase [Burkholderiales bacterium]|nr:aldo/keto reductase [Burkholderiales bacterium]
METVELASGFRVSRIAKGNWQLAERHGPPVERERAIEDMRAFVEAGITLFDCADHYVGVEELIGEFRRRYPEHAKRLRVSTKLVPDLDQLASLRRADVERIVDRSLARLGVERLDLVQFHWWDWRIPGYVEAMHWMKEMQAAGKIALIGTTNFDSPRLAEVVASGVPVATNQLQYSVLDRRPERAMVSFCLKHGIRLLCYGVLAGGFIGRRWLGAPEPQPPFANRSLVKYRLIIEDFGGWARFQKMLAVLDAIARRRGVSLSSVAARYILDKPGVAVAIVGARSAAHLAETLEIDRLRLTDAERAEIAALADTAPGPAGDCYELERIEGGPHNAIMWKNQNTAGAPREAPYADAPPAYRPRASNAREEKP